MPSDKEIDELLAGVAGSAVKLAVLSDALVKIRAAPEGLPANAWDMTTGHLKATHEALTNGLRRLRILD